jgi:hypothetical protein
MFKLLFATVCIGCLLSCNGQSPRKDKTGVVKNKNSNMVEGKDYFILKRFRVTDQYGFSQPLEVSSFLLPANWQVTGGVQWNGRNKCLPEMVQASMQAFSPGKEYELFLFPVTQFDWSTDPVYLDAMQRGFNMHSCYIAQPQDAAGYISRYMAPYLKAQVKTAQPIAQLQQQMDQGAMQMTNAARQAGNNAYSHRGSAAEGVLQFSDGKEGLAFCTLMQTIVSMPGAQGGIAHNYQCYVSMRMVLKYKAGNEAAARKIMSTLFTSARINPQWANGVQAFYAAIARGAQDETWKKIQYSHQAQQEISNNIVRSWEARNSNSNGRNGNAIDNNGQFGQYLRGVENYTDDAGNKIELTSGYSHAWSKGDGSYLLSNNPAFDPNVTFNEDWKRLSK